MRRVIFVVFVILALVAWAAPATAGFTSNSRGSEVIVEGGWYQGDWGDETIVSGFASARQAQGAQTGEIFFSESIGERVVCDNGTPDDPDDDWIGYSWTETYGWGPATVTVGHSYTSGTAHGTVEAWTATWSECGGSEVTPENGGSPGPAVEVTLSLEGYGPLIRQRDSFSFHIPGQYNDHGSSRSVYRSATGSAMLDAKEIPVSWGQIGEYSWSYHSNGK